MVKAVAVGGIGCGLGRDEVDVMGLLRGRPRKDSARACWNSVSF